MEDPYSRLASLVILGGGLLCGAIVNAAVQALSSRASYASLDVLSLLIAALVVWLPVTSTGRLVGLSAGAVLISAVINRRTDMTNRIVGWVHMRCWRLFDRSADSHPGSLP